MSNQSQTEAELTQALQQVWDTFCAKVYQDFPMLDSLLLVPIWTIPSRQLPDVVVSDRPGFVKHLGNLFRAANQTQRAHFQMLLLTGDYLQAVEAEAQKLVKQMESLNDATNR